MKSPISDVVIPDTSVPKLMLERATSHGDRTGYIDAVTGDHFTFRQVADKVKRFASALARRGFRKGDVACIYAQNTIDFPIIFFAIASTGGGASLANYQFTPGELETQLRDSRSKILICGQTIVDKAKVAAKGVATIKEIIVIGHAPGCTPISDLYRDDGTMFALAEIDPRNDVVGMPYSSGTTGTSKGVVLTHYSLLASLSQMSHPAVTQNSRPGSETFVIFSPFSHIYALMQSMLITYHGDKMVVMPNFHMEQYMQCIQKYRATVLNLVPPIAVLLTTHPMVDKYDFSSVRDIFCGAAPLDQKITEKLLKRIGVSKLRQGYGMSEFNGTTHIDTHKGWKHGSIGPVLPNMEIKVIDVETGKELGPNQDGELWMKGPNMMKEYLNNPTATKDTIDSDGFLHSGDVGHYDEDGHFYIVDRLKELIKYKAYQVAPAELEAVLLQHSDVIQAGVVGIPDLVAGELPKAFVVMKPGSKVTPEEIQLYVEERVGAHKRLRGGVQFVHEVPTSPSGKILRRHLRAQYVGQNSIKIQEAKL